MNSNTLNYNFNLGQLYYEKTDFYLAKPLLQKSAEFYYSQSDIRSYLQTLNILLSIYREQRNVRGIDETALNLQSLYLKKNDKLTCDMYYTMALCETYGGNHQRALDYFEEALNLALSQNQQEDICHIIIGLSTTYMELDCLDEALREIKTLPVFFQVLELPRVEFMSELVCGRILHKMGQNKLALDIFERCCENLYTHKNLYACIELFYFMGIAYLNKGDLNSSRWYLSLSQRMIDPKNLIRLNALVVQALESLSKNSSEEFDLIFSESLGVLTERHKGEVNLKNQVIVMNMLKLFLSRPGEVYSKEKLAVSIWRQHYNPQIHDNKIYVTIQRLKQMIEPNYDKPRYIFRSKKGYYLSKYAKVNWH